MTDDLKPQLKLSQQLVMTPQLQLALKLLTTPSTELPALIASHALEPLPDGEPDPLGAISDEEREHAEELGIEPWSFRDTPDVVREADVGVFGNPPEVRANRAASPRVRIVATADKDRLRDAAWLLRALRQRAKAYEKVIAVIAELRPQIATTTAFPPVPVREVAERLGMHESTISRVVTAVRYQTIHGVHGLKAGKKGITGV
jgi:DNA-directed RNA polymerase specialized sigma54-like protein